MRARHPSFVTFAVAELRARSGRALALGAGILVAAVCFGLLSSETATSNISVTSTVKKNFRAAYDILVRPKGAETAFEKAHGLVDDSFLSGLFGGITMAQYREIMSLPGVALAAPVANVGYFLVQTTTFVPFPDGLPRSNQAVYRVDINWDVHNGVASYPGGSFYLYYTNRQLTFSANNGALGTEQAPGHVHPLAVCSVSFGSGSGAPLAPGQPVANPYQASLEPMFACASPHIRTIGLGSDWLSGIYNVTKDGQLGAEVTFDLPVLVAGVDPTAENELVGLKGAMVSGDYLSEGGGLSGPVSHVGFGGKVREYPVLGSTQTYLDETARLTIRKLNIPSLDELPEKLASGGAGNFLEHLSGPVIARTSLSPTSAWRSSLSNFDSGATATAFEDAYWRVSATGLRASLRGVLLPQTVRNDPRVWTDNSATSAVIGISLAPPGSNDTWYRRLTIFGSSGQLHVVNGQQTRVSPIPKLVGTFDPNRLRGFSPLSRVPLQTFYPPTVSAGNAAARKKIGSTPLGPTTNLGGYLSQPPLLLTTLNGAIALDNGYGESYVVHYKYRDSSGRERSGSRLVEAYWGASPAAPISTIQVRVKGVTGPNPISLARIKLVAEDISARTGLTVDVTAGSSPTPERIQFSAGKFGEPKLLVDQGWVKKDVDSEIILALSGEDLALLVLVILVCALFVASVTSASVRQRRREIAILSTLGWPAHAIFAVVIGEAALVGLTAGVIGCGITIPIAAAGSLDIPAVRLFLVVPIAVVLAMASAVIPATRAARIPPLEALRAPVIRRAARRRVRTVTGLAVANLLRIPGRSLLASTTLALGVGALAFIVGITVAFRGEVAGDLLGNVVALNVRGVDVVSSALVVVVGAASVADILIVNLRERAAELATLRALGWRERSIISMAAREGLMLGVVSSIVGAGLGIGVVAALTPPTSDVLVAASLAVLSGCLVTMGALAIPLARLGRESPANGLTGE
jgi:putative ABC transport system permease protein